MDVFLHGSLAISKLQYFFPLLAATQEVANVTSVLTKQLASGSVDAAVFAAQAPTGAPGAVWTHHWPAVHAVSSVAVVPGVAPQLCDAVLLQISGSVVSQIIAFAAWPVHALIGAPTGGGGKLVLPKRRGDTDALQIKSPAIASWAKIWVDDKTTKSCWIYKKSWIIHFNFT